MGNFISKNPVKELPQRRPHVFFRDLKVHQDDDARPAAKLEARPVAKLEERPTAAELPVVTVDMPSLVPLEPLRPEYVFHKDYATPTVTWPSVDHLKFGIYADSPVNSLPLEKLDKHTMKKKNSRGGP